MSADMYRHARRAQYESRNKYKLLLLNAFCSHSFRFLGVPCVFERPIANFTMPGCFYAFHPRLPFYHNVFVKHALGRILWDIASAWHSDVCLRKETCLIRLELWPANSTLRFACPLFLKEFVEITLRHASKVNFTILFSSFQVRFYIEKKKIVKLDRVSKEY